MLISAIAAFAAGIFVMASTTHSAYQGGVLLFIYSLGLSLPLMLLSTYLQKSKSSIVYKILKGKAYEVKIGSGTIRIHTNSLISGLLFVVIGVLILSGILTSINSIGANISVLQKLQVWSFGIEQWIL